MNAAKPGTILAVSGTCHGAFTVGKNLVLKGASAAVLDAQQTGATLTVTAGKVRVTRMTITGGRSDDVGGVLDRGMLTLVRDTVNGNQSGGGDTETGGIENDGTLVMQHSVVAGNQSDDVGGILNTGSATLDQSTVGPNGGSAITTTGSLTLTDSTVYRNHSTYDGGIVSTGALHGPPLDDRKQPGVQRRRGGDQQLRNGHYRPVRQSPSTRKTRAGPGSGTAAR